MFGKKYSQNGTKAGSEPNVYSCNQFLTMIWSHCFKQSVAVIQRTDPFNSVGMPLLILLVLQFLCFPQTGFPNTYISLHWYIKSKCSYLGPMGREGIQPYSQAIILIESTKAAQERSYFSVQDVRKK